MTVWTTCSQYSELDRVALLSVECPVICQMQQLLVSMVTTHGLLSVFSSSLCRRKAVGGSRKWWLWGQKDCMFISAVSICELKWRVGAVKECMNAAIDLAETVTHCASLHWVTCVSFVQGLYAKSMLYRRMCMANTWNSWSKKEDNTRNVSDAWQGPARACSFALFHQ